MSLIKSLIKNELKNLINRKPDECDYLNTLDFFKAVSNPKYNMTISDVVLELKEWIKEEWITCPDCGGKVIKEGTHHCNGFYKDENF